MEYARAAELIAGISYKPGWAFRLEKSWRAGNWAYLTIVMESVDTDKRWAPTYPRPITLAPEFEIDLARMSDADALYAKVFENILWLETHEAREFFGVNGQRYDKPYHPHVPTSVPTWDRHASQIALAVTTTWKI